MMKYIFLLLIGLSVTVFSSGQTLTSVYVPTIMQGTASGSIASEHRVPYVCRLTVDGLTPNTSYNYTTQFSTNPFFPDGDGGCIFVNPNGTFTLTNLPDLTSAGSYGTFTTNAAGSYTGWFIGLPTPSFYFSPGAELYFALNINDGAGGTWANSFLATAETIKVVDFGTASTDGTALRSTAATGGTAGNFVMLYDKENPTSADRPITGTFIESDGTDNSLTNFFADFYAASVDGVNKAWGVLIPNDLVGGIKKIAQYSKADGTEVGASSSATGDWAKQGGGTVSTVNASGGLSTPVVLDGSIVTLTMAVRQSQTITFTAPAAKVYGSADFNPGATASSALEVTYTSSNTAVATIVNGNTIHITGAGTTTITVEQGGNNAFLPAAPVAHTLTVDKAPLTITAENKTKVQGDPMPTLTVKYTGFVNGENASALITTPTITTTATQGSAAGQYPITVSGADAANYTIAYVPGTLTVTSNKQNQTIAFNTIAAKTYGAADFDPGASTTSGLTIAYTSSNPAVATIVNGDLHITGVGTTTITASQAGDANYEPAANVTQTLTVSKAPLTIKANDQARFVGQANPTLTVSYTGFVYNETNVVLTTQPVTSTTATTGSAPGNYPITATGAAAANYTITYTDGTLTVKSLLAQTISFPALPVKRYGDADFTATATATSGLAITYSSSNPQVATIQGNVIHITGAGTTTITGSQSGNSEYEAAPAATATLIVQKANLQIQAVDTSRLEGESNPRFEVVYSGFVNGDDAGDLTTRPMVGTVATAASLVANYSITVTGAASPNYNIAQVNGTLRVLPAQGAGQDNVTAWISAPGQLRVNIHAAKEGKATIQLFDQSGNRLLQKTVTAAKGTSAHAVPVGNLVSGVYYLRVNGPDFIIKNKLIIR